MGRNTIRSGEERVREREKWEETQLEAGRRESEREREMGRNTIRSGEERVREREREMGRNTIRSGGGGMRVNFIES